MLLRSTAILATALLGLGLAGCTNPEADLVISVTQDASTCDLSQTEFEAGVITFAIKNVGSTTAEFYIYKFADDGIVAEVENIGAGLTRELTAQLSAGKYRYACKQFDDGDAITGTLTVSGANETPIASQAQAAAIAGYETFVQAQASLLLDATEKFTAAIIAKDVELAKNLYPSARSHWERIEPVAESFGDLDPRMDAREGDLEEGVDWTGWHALEKQLWVSGLDATSPKIAEQLLTDTQELISRISEIELNISQLGNGAKALMDEVATGKITGEEERYSHTDLWDFAANVEGSQKVVEVTSPILTKTDPELLAVLTERFAALNDELAKYQSGSGYKLYTELTGDQIKTLARLVEAVSEPLSQLTAAIIK